MNEDPTTLATSDDSDGTQMPAMDAHALPVDEPVLQHAPVAPVAPVTGLPSNADDVDLIEKEWVEKAKEIVDGTTGDPYTQAKQLGQMKAEYVRKRYGRDLKTGE